MQTRFNQIKLRAWSFAILTVASFLLSIRVSGIKNPNVDIIGHTTGSNIQSDTINGHLISKSTVISGLKWLGPRMPYTGSLKADTYPLTWADDNLIYSSGGDPVSEKKNNGLEFLSIDGTPANYTISVVNEMPDFLGWGGQGLKPTGMLCRKGVLYLFAHNLGKQTNENMEKCHGYDAQIFMSKDHGETWFPDIKTVENSPMFPGRDFGSPCFVNYGKDNAGATDGFVYALSGEGWANGNHLKVGRVPADRIMDATAWEFISKFRAGRKPVWVRNFRESIPVLRDPGFLGYPECVYIASLKRYLLLGWRFKVEKPDKYSPDDGSELAIYESPKPWGPFALVAKMDWETPEVTPYNPRLPLKWFDNDKLEGYLLFSGSWRNGGSSEFYRAQVRRFKLERNKQ